MDYVDVPLLDMWVTHNDYHVYKGSDEGDGDDNSGDNSNKDNDSSDMIHVTRRR